MADCKGLFDSQFNTSAAEQRRHKVLDRYYEATEPQEQDQLELSHPRAGKYLPDYDPGKE